MALNILKCGVISHSHNTCSTHFIYNLNNFVLQRPFTFRDFSVMFQVKLSLNHISSVICKSLRTFGFIICHSCQFTRFENFWLLKLLLPDLDWIWMHYLWCKSYKFINLISRKKSILLSYICVKQLATATDRACIANSLQFVIQRLNSIRM